MTQSRLKPVSFDEFMAWYPESSEYSYELHNGVIVEMPKFRGKHSEIAGFLAYKLNVAIETQGVNFFIPRECVLKPFRHESGYEPDVVVLDIAMCAGIFTHYFLYAFSRRHFELGCVNT